MPFKRADVVSHSEVIETFKVGNMGGMRRSLATNSLVLISDHTKPLYEDKWFGDILHYTGMGKSGDQVLSKNQNRTLAESNANGVEVHLFEVLIPMQYIYLGRVVLAGEPYQEVQKGEDGVPRLVWMFPLRPAEGSETITEEILNKNIEIKEKLAKRLSDEKVKELALQNQSEKVSSRAVISNTFIRDRTNASIDK